MFLTADHGGVGFAHPPEDERSQQVPWIVSGPSIRRFDLAAIPGLKVDVMSTFSTAAVVLGLDVSHHVDSRPVLDVFTSRSSPGGF
jgi:hypothetical protein